MTPTPASVPTSAEVRAYISDMLSQLAEMAHRIGDRRMASLMRLLAVEAEAAADGRARQVEGGEG